MYYKGESLLSYCGFKKFHPHDHDSIIRVAYKSASTSEPADKMMVRGHLKKACRVAEELYADLYGKF